MIKHFFLFSLLCMPVLTAACAGDVATVATSQGTGGGGGGSLSAGGGGAGGGVSACDKDCSVIPTSEPCVEGWVCNESEGRCERKFVNDGGKYSGDQVPGDCRTIVCAGDVGTRLILADDPPAPTTCTVYSCDDEGKVVSEDADPPGVCAVSGMECKDGACESTSAGPECNDGVKNGLETDVDCGGDDGVCVRCGAGSSCQRYNDCAGRQHCTAHDKICAPAAVCDTSEKNLSLEPDLCGMQGSTFCGKCASGVSCASPEVCTRDCASGTYAQDCSGLDCLNVFNIKYKCK